MFRRGNGSSIYSPSRGSQSIGRRSYLTSPDRRGRLESESLCRAPWRQRRGHNLGVRKASQCWCHLSCILKVFKWQRKEGKLFWHKEQVSKGTKYKGAWCVWEREGDQGFWNVISGAGLCWPVPTESPSLKYGFLGVKLCIIPFWISSTYSELGKLFPSEWVREKKN